MIVQTEVWNPARTHIGVRVHNGKSGVWAGALPEEYQADKLERIAREMFRERS